VDAQWISCRELTPEQVPKASCLLSISQTHPALSIVPYQREAEAASLGVAFLAEDQPGVYADVFYPSVERWFRDYGTKLRRRRRISAFAPACSMCRSLLRSQPRIRPHQQLVELVLRRRFVAHHRSNESPDES
jgi:hypothetical protein